MGYIVTYIVFELATDLHGMVEHRRSSVARMRRKIYLLLWYKRKERWGGTKSTCNTHGAREKAFSILILK